MKKYAVYLMGAFYTFMGILHFVIPERFVAILKGFPYPKELTLLSGIAELILGIGVCIPATRKYAAWGIILLLIAVFPANINMAIKAQELNINPAILYARLPLQFLLIWWAYVYTKKQVIT